MHKIADTFTSILPSPSALRDVFPGGRTFGFELELFLLDHEGRIAHQADRIIGSLRHRLLDSELKRECAHSMLELTSFPHISAHAVLGSFFADVETLLASAERQGLRLFNYGTYPGHNPARMRESVRYAAQRRIFGEQQFLNAGRCIGFHFHFALPSGSLSPETKFFFFDLHEAKRKRVLNLYNFYTALDPALIALLQSSPYFESKLYGKDARVMAYRGDMGFRFPHSLYERQPEFGILNEYEPDFPSLLSRTRARTSRWSQILREHGVDPAEFAKDMNPSPLDSSWKPVKVSSHETIESRGSDMNKLKLLSAASIVLKHLSRAVHSSTLRVMPSELGDDKPFLVEENVLHVPRFNRLRSLQYGAARAGLENRGVTRYCESLLRSARSLCPESARSSLRILSQVVEERKTTSDEVIDFVKRRQGRKEHRTIDDETAQELAVHVSDLLYKDLVLTRKLFEQE